MDRRDSGGNAGAVLPARRRFTARSLSAFSRYNLPDDLIALAVRWYLGSFGERDI